MTTRPILCFGEALIDFHAEGDDGHGFAQHFLPFAGGAPANVAVAVARLGGTARFAGMLSRDPFGDFLLDSLKRAGVGIDDIARTDEANTALAFVTLDTHGERSFTFYRASTADLLFRPAHFRVDTFHDAAVFHVCSNSMTDPRPLATACNARTTLAHWSASTSTCAPRCGQPKWIPVHCCGRPYIRPTW